MEKLVLITGASRGIGMAIAKRLGRDGYCVIGTATSEAGASAISDYLAAESIKGEGFCLDVTDSDMVVSVLAEIEAKYQAPDILVNNAGITRDNLLMRMKPEDWLAVINTNLNSVFTMTKQCMKPMIKKRWGRIISVGSVVARGGSAGQTNYAASKAALEGFGRSLARELGPRGITVNTVAPGYIQTDMTDAMTDDAKAHMQSQITLGRLGQPEEVAAVVAMLAGDDGAYITGETIQVNGGLYMA